MLFVYQVDLEKKLNENQLLNDARSFLFIRINHTGIHTYIHTGIDRPFVDSDFKN